MDKHEEGGKVGGSTFPFPFLLVAECLAWMTNQAISTNLKNGLGPSDAFRITLIEFTDNTFFLL